MRPCIRPSKRGSRGSTCTQLPGPTTSRSGPFLRGTSPFRVESWVSVFLTLLQGLRGRAGALAEPGRCPLGSSRGSQVPDSLWVTPTFSLWEDVITQCLGLWLGRAFARGAGTHSCGPTTFNFALMKEVVSSEILTRPPG